MSGSVALALKARWAADGILSGPEREVWSRMLAEVFSGAALEAPAMRVVPVALSAVVEILETREVRLTPAGFGYVARAVEEARARTLDYDARRYDASRGEALARELEKLSRWGKARGFFFQYVVAKEAAAWIRGRMPTKQTKQTNDGGKL